MTLTTLERAKEYLGLVGTGEDDLVSHLIDWATVFIHSYCHRVFPLRSYDEYYDGDGTDSLLCNQFPISSVDSLEVDGIGKDPASFTLYGPIGLMRLKSGVFPKGKNNIRIRFSAGYAEIPKDLEQSCIELVALKYYDRGRERLGLEKSSNSTSFVSRLPWEIKQVLDLYRRYGV